MSRVPFLARIAPGTATLSTQCAARARAGTVTRNGKAAAVILSPEDLAELEETLAVLSDPEALADIREADLAYQAGDADAVRALLP